MKHKIVLVLLALSSLAAASNVKISEKTLVELARKQNQNSERAILLQKQAALAKSEFLEMYQPSLTSSVGYSDSLQKSISPFAPTFAPTTKYEVGINKNIGYGTTASLNAFSDQISTPDKSIDQATESGVRLNLNIDLWKNAFGSLERKQLKSISSKKKVALLKSQINQKMFENSVRKIYWSLVANQEKLKVANGIKDTAEYQLTEVRKRKKASVAENDEVYRYEAQYSVRLAQITALNYERNKILLQLKSLLPELNGSNLSLSEYNINKTIAEVMSCTAKIKSQKKIPWDETQIDEILKALDEDHKLSKAINNKHNDMNLAFIGEYELSANEKGFSDSLGEVGTEARPSYALGLQLSVPLGGAKSSTTVLKNQVATAQYMAERHELESSVKARYEQMVSMVDLLNRNALLQEKSANQLEQVIKETNRKYDQARVSVDALVNDQNALLNSKIDQINSRLAIINELFDYFSIFTESTCGINSI